jgi:SAM-dependent methyltransferase
MDRWKYFDIVHADHTFWNPLSEAKVTEIIDLLRLEPAARVLDIGCGRAEFLFRLCERWGASAVGVDRSPFCAAGARERAAERGLAGRVEIVEADGAAYPAVPHSFDASICLGASWVWGGHAGTLAALKERNRPGGFVVAGEPYWRKDPPPDYLETSGLTREMFGTHASNVAAGREAGLTFLHAIVSNEDDWDRYEGLHCYAAERYAAEHPDDPDNAGLLERVRADYGTYVRWGRDHLGWAVYIFRA